MIPAGVSEPRRAGHWWESPSGELLSSKLDLRGGSAKPCSAPGRTFLVAGARPACRIGSAGDSLSSSLSGDGRRLPAQKTTPATPTKTQRSQEMTQKNKFEQQSLWLFPATDHRVELSADQRRELTAALADLLLQLAGASDSDAREQGKENGGHDHADYSQDHA